MSELTDTAKTRVTGQQYIKCQKGNKRNERKQKRRKIKIKSKNNQQENNKTVDYIGNLETEFLCACV